MNKYKLALIKMLFGVLAIAVFMSFIYLMTHSDFAQVIAGAIVVAAVCYVVGDLITMIWKHHKPKPSIFERKKRKW